MSNSGDVNITILDNGGSQITVPLSSVQAVIGCATKGSSFAITATNNPITLQAACGYGIGVEAAAMTCAQGSVVLFCQVPVTTKGTATAVAITAGNTSTVVVTTSLDGTYGAYDDYYVKVLVAAAGVRGTADSKAIQISLDAGRTYGPPIALGAATTYAIPNTGVTLAFAAGTFVAGDSWTFGTLGMGWAVGDVSKAITALVNSQFGVIGWGSMHIVGNGGSNAGSGKQGIAGADATTIQGYLDAVATVTGGQVFTRAFVSARDASPPAAYGGTGESESTWISAVNADFSTVSAKRICAGAANWNMASAYANASAGTPAYRRNIAWAAAAKQSTAPAQRHIGRVSDGALPQISIFSQDAADSFIYHNEAMNGGLDYIATGTGGRFMTTRLRRKKPGVFITNPLLLAAVGSSFWMLPYGAVIDIACDIMTQVGDDFINDDVRTNPNGTIFETDAANLEKIFEGAINTEMLANNMISPGTKVVIDRTNNLNTTGVVNWTLTIVARGYILTENGSIGFANASAA